VAQIKQAVAAEMARLVERTRKLERSQRVLFDVASALGPSLAIDPVLKIALAAVRDVVDDVKGGTIVLLEGAVLRIAACEPAVSPDVLAMRLPVSRGLSGYVVRNRVAYRTGNLLTDPHLDVAAAGTGSNATIVSWMGVPLIVLGSVIGLIQVDSAREDAFDDADESAMVGLGALVAGAIESARRYEALAGVARLKAEFLERVSHELRTPMTIMQGYADTLGGIGEQLDEVARRSMVDRIAAASRRMGYLVEEMLTMASLDADSATPSPVVVGVRELLEATVASVGANEKVELRLPIDLTVHCDPVLLRQVLAPLVDNVVKYAQTGWIEVAVVGDRLNIYVCDAGPGVPSEIAERVFDRFVRGGHTLAGMGLGLAISRDLAVVLRATVRLEDAQQGARFVVQLPIE
jgi:signal transduction histidine kinase